MMGRIIYKRSSVSHIYLWVAIGFARFPPTPCYKRRLPDFNLL